MRWASRTAACKNVDLGDVGSSPLAASTSNGLDVKVVYITSMSGNDEALVARNGSGINTLADLRGKRLSAAPVSTDHYQLLAVLKQEGIPESTAKVMPMPQPQIVAAWERGDLDAAFVWDPALGELLKSGKRLLTSSQVADRGAPTFGAFVATTKFATAHPDFITAFVRQIDRYYVSFTTEPAKWAAESDNAKKLAQLLGGTPQDQADRLKDVGVVPLREQLSTAWLVGGDNCGVAKMLKDTAGFLQSQQKISEVLPSYGRFIAPQFIQAAGT
jgi:taurine transport system substrate-binding protein